MIQRGERAQEKKHGFFYVGVRHDEGVWTDNRHKIQGNFSLANCFPSIGNVF